jgi:hypothetical protein
MRIKKTVESLVTAMTSTDVAAIERELTKLEQRRAQLAESLDAATHNAINASAARRDLIIANRDQRTLDEANAKVRGAEEQRLALDDALRALDQKIAETTTLFEEAKDKAERDRVAQVLEQEADAVEKEALAVDKAAKEFASAVQKLRSALSSASCLRTPDRHRLGEDRVAGLLAAEALAGATPDLFVDQPDELGVASVLHRGFPLGDDVVRFVTRDQQRCAKRLGLVSMPSVSSRHVCVLRLMQFAPAMNLLFFLLLQNRCTMSGDVPFSATSCSSRRCDIPTDLVSPSCTTPGRLVSRRR